MYIILEINIERYKKREIYIVLFLDETTLSVVSKFSFVFLFYIIVKISLNIDYWCSLISTTRGQI